MVHHPCIFGDPQQRGQSKSGPKEWRNATPPLHSRGSPTKGTNSKRAQKRGEVLHHPCILGAHQQMAQNQRGPKKGHKMLHHPYILGGPQQRGQNQSGPKRGRKCYITLAFSGVTNKWDKIKAGPK